MAGANFGAIANIASSIGGTINQTNQHGLNSEQQALNQGLHSALQSAGPYGAIISAAASLVDGTMGALGLSFNKVDDKVANKAGAKGANKANEILAAIPGNQIWGLLGTNLKEGTANRYTDFSSYTNDQFASGRVLFGGRKLQKWNNKVSGWNNTKNIIGDTAKLALNNSAGELYQSQNFNTFSGYSPKAITVGKYGLKIDVLQESRNILESSSNKNIIVIGSLHSQNNNLSDENENLKDNITTKGIPVIKEHDNEIIQTAEIESEELVINKSFTEQLEDLYNKYNETNSNDIAIEAGKLICDQILNNTIDEGDVISKHQLGGKLNLIPNGELHARNHNLEEVNPDLEGNITKKGIPVVSEVNGEIIQTAEIEREEWTLRKEFTDKLEDLYKQYLQDHSDDIVIEAGKLTCFELLKNTDDQAGLIKNTK